MRIALALALVALAVTASANAGADQPADPNANCVCPPQDLKSRSSAKHVFIGKAVERNDDPKHEGEAMPANAEYRFEVVDWLKGELPDPVWVRTFAVTCSTTFDIGQTYVVFGNRNEYKQMTASYCSGNRIATNEVAAEIKKILAPKGDGKKPSNGSKSDKSSKTSKTDNKSGSESGGMSIVTKGAIGAGAAVLLVVLFLLLRRKRD